MTVDILEISLEKESRNDEVKDEVIAKFLHKIGIKQDQVEGVQLSPSKAPSKIFVWLKPEVDINQFCFCES